MAERWPLHLNGWDGSSFRSVLMFKTEACVSNLQFSVLAVNCESKGSFFGFEFSNMQLVKKKITVKYSLGLFTVLICSKLLRILHRSAILWIFSCVCAYFIFFFTNSLWVNHKWFETLFIWCFFIFLESISGRRAGEWENYDTDHDSLSLQVIWKCL